MYDLTKQTERVRLIKDIASEENYWRKVDSYNIWQVYNDRIKKYVEYELERQLGAESREQMPIISSVNLAKRIVNSEASIYKSEPSRSFTELSEDQEQAIGNIYKDMKADTMLMRSNRAKRLEKQNHIMIIPKDGKLVMKSLNGYQLDMIPDKEDPSKPYGYVISGFDRYKYDQNSSYDNRNLDIADKDDQRAALTRHVVWTKDLNFIMDGRGNILTEENENPIAPNLPVIEVSEDKDFEYWLDCDQSLFDFTVHFNTVLSKHEEIVHLQGFAQAYLKAPRELQPTQISIGPNKILRLMTDPRTEAQTEFGFVSPNADLAGGQAHIESLLSYYLTSRGADPSTITSGGSSQTFSSGIERLLSMIEKFEASQSDIALYRETESKIYELIKVWHNTLVNTDTIDSKYLSGVIPDDSSIIVEYQKPEMYKTNKEQLEIFQNEKELEIASRIDQIQEYYGFENREQAIEKAEQIDNDEMMVMMPSMESGGEQSDQMQTQSIEGVALNGAQVTALVGVVGQFKSGLLDRDSALAVITSSFPINRDKAETILGTKTAEASKLAKENL